MGDDPSQREACLLAPYMCTSHICVRLVARSNLLLLHTHTAAAEKWRIERWVMNAFHSRCRPRSGGTLSSRVLPYCRRRGMARRRGEMRVFALTVCTYCVIHSSSSIAPHARLCCWEV